jgi:hypothetical protein
MRWSKLLVKGLPSAMHAPNDPMHWDGLFARRSLNQRLGQPHFIQGCKAKAVLPFHQYGGKLLPSVLHQRMVECIIGIQAAAEVGRPEIAGGGYVQRFAGQPEDEDWEADE